MRPLRTLLTCLAVLVPLAVPGCAADSGDNPDADETEPESTSDSALTSNVDCHIRTDTAYVSGRPSTIKLITIGGKPTSIAVGHQFLKMQKAASAAGVRLAINSGFRTMAEQQHLYRCYQTHSCNNGNLAARPGYSNHQGGFALDLTTSSWLASNAGRFGFRRTVPSEAWHYEYHGPDTGGPCSGGGAAEPDDNAPAASGGGAACQSFTLGREVAAGTCVQRDDDDKWYVCDGGDWPVIGGPDDPSCKSCPQLAGGRCR